MAGRGTGDTEPLGGREATRNLTGSLEQNDDRRWKARVGETTWNNPALSQRLRALAVHLARVLLQPGLLFCPEEHAASPRREVASIGQRPAGRGRCSLPWGVVER
eukprot:591207-Hanusia_phi.AAC.4